MGCHLYTQSGRSSPSSLAMRRQRGLLHSAPSPSLPSSPAEHFLASACHVVLPSSACHVVLLSSSPISAPLPSGCKVRQDRSTRLPVSSVQSVFPPSQMLGLVRGLVKHSAKENCQWFMIADGALNGFLYNLKTCSMIWPQRPFSKISLFLKWQNYHPKSTVYISIHSWCCTFYGLGHMYNDMYSLLQYHTENFFYCHKNPLCSAYSSLLPPWPPAIHWSLSCFHSLDDNDMLTQVHQ